MIDLQANRLFVCNNFLVSTFSLKACKLLLGLNSVSFRTGTFKLDSILKIPKHKIYLERQIQGRSVGIPTQVKNMQSNHPLSVFCWGESRPGPGLGFLAPEKRKVLM